jgi:hypothetical protein
MATETLSPPRHAKLIGKLANRLRENLDVPSLPLIVQNRTPRTRTVHLLVVWDEWQNVPNAERSEIVTTAYAVAHPDDQFAVNFPLAYTPSEALSLGYLPYRIVALVRPTDRIRKPEIERAMRSVGGIYLKVGTAPQLRFASQAQAEDAYRSLATKLPSPVWTLIQEQSGSDPV